MTNAKEDIYKYLKENWVYIIFNSLVVFSVIFVWVADKVHDGNTVDLGFIEFSKQNFFLLSKLLFGLFMVSGFVGLNGKKGFQLVFPIFTILLALLWFKATIDSEKISKGNDEINKAKEILSPITINNAIIRDYLDEIRINLYILSDIKERANSGIDVDKELVKMLWQRNNHLIDNAKQDYKEFIKSNAGFPYLDFDRDGELVKLFEDQNKISSDLDERYKGILNNLMDSKSIYEHLLLYGKEYFEKPKSDKIDRLLSKIPDEKDKTPPKSLQESKTPEADEEK